MKTKEILSLDVGQKHIGIARGSSVAKLSEPLMSVAPNQIMKKLTEYTKEHDVEAIVVGLPRNLSAEDTKQTDFVRDWVTGAKSKFQVPFYWQDEALTSIEAQKKFDSKKVDEHALAAAIVLQDWLDAPESERVMC